jgi:hypothetical protein
MKRILFAAVAAFMLTSSVDAAEISCLDPLCERYLLRGEIAKGDYEKVVKSLIYPWTYMFNLVSPGGHVDEALKIGRLFRKYLIAVDAPYRRQSDGSLQFREICRGQNCTCVSACALIWFGGVDRGGTVGLHRPYINDPRFSGLSPLDASREYRRMLKNVTVYLNEMEVPRSIIESIVSTSSGDIRWVDMFDEGLDRPPSIAEWVDASCGRGDPHMEALRQGKELSPQQWERLKSGKKKKNECELDLFEKHRKVLFGG